MLACMFPEYMYDTPGTWIWIWIPNIYIHLARFADPPRYICTGCLGPGIVLVLGFSKYCKSDFFAGA